MIRSIRRAAVHGLLLLAVAGGAPAFAQTFKIATLSPAGSSWMKLMRAGADEISERTEGRVGFRFYPNGVMGDDRAVLRKIRFGQLQGAAVTAGSLADFYRGIEIYSLPMAFRDYAEVDAVREVLDPVLSAGLEDAGFVAFGFGEAGFAYAMSQQRAVTVAEAREQKVWVPADDEAALTAIEAFGITPVPLGVADVLAGLQTGLIDAVAVPPVGALALQWYTQVDYAIDLPLMYIYGVLAVDEKAFGRVSPADQAIVREVMTRTFDAITRTNREDAAGAMQALRNQGIELLGLEPDQRATWQGFADEAVQRLIEEGVVDAMLHERMQGILEAYRAAP